MGTMTLEEFKNGYAERSGVTVAWLCEHGRLAAPCDCKEDGCIGWQMKHANDVKGENNGKSNNLQGL